jgi:hypothetical protein
MPSNTNIRQKNNYKAFATALGAWLVAFATLFGAADISRQPVVVNMMRPAYAYVSPGLNLWSRNDSENETVHMPTKFDIGLQTAAVGGHR